jgi:hypothetical protein
VLIRDARAAGGEVERGELEQRLHRDVVVTAGARALEQGPCRGEIALVAAHAGLFQRGTRREQTLWMIGRELRP